jgi:hypothetical protein
MRGNVNTWEQCQPYQVPISELELIFVCVVGADILCNICANPSLESNMDVITERFLKCGIAKLLYSLLHEIVDAFGLNGARPLYVVSDLTHLDRVQA